MVEKIIKDKIYTSNKVWDFLHTPHNAISPELALSDELPGLVITLLEVKSIWIEGRGGEPSRQAWNLWISHPMKIPHFHLNWIAVLKSAFLIVNINGYGGKAHAIRVSFFCKGCKGGSHPTSQCPLKEQLGNLLKKLRDKGHQNFRGRNRGGCGGYV